MGGYRSGRKAGYAVGFTTSDCINLDVRRLQSLKMLGAGSSRTLATTDDIAGRSFEVQLDAQADLITLQHLVRRDGVSETIEYDIPLSNTPTQFGGVRRWFLCPAVGCGRRVAILYLRGFFQCRHCSDLSYDSQRGGEVAVLISKLRRLRRKLGWDGAVIEGPEWTKTKGMHLKTYYRLCAEYTKLDERLNLLLPYRI